MNKVNEHTHELGNNTTISQDYTLSGLTGSALARQTPGRLFAPLLLQQVLRFVARIYTVRYVELRECRVGGNGQSI